MRIAQSYYLDAVQFFSSSGRVSHVFGRTNEEECVVQAVPGPIVALCQSQTAPELEAVVLVDSDGQTRRWPIPDPRDVAPTTDEPLAFAVTTDALPPPPPPPPAHDPSRSLPQGLPRNPTQECVVIQDLNDRQPKAGESWFVLSAAWWQRWGAYSGYVCVFVCDCFQLMVFD